jgi:glycerol-3-phosphate dehydrogenase (NAD+)
VFQKLFDTSFFYTTIVNDVVGTEMCGTLKNIVALAAGMTDGLDFGANTKVGQG